MKPRWKVQPHTFEDVEIRMLVDMRFLHLAGRPLLEWPSFSWILSDRRDSDLMWWAQWQARWIQTQNGLSHNGGPLRLWGIDFGGAAQR
jgi:hypothetical protein